MSENLFLIVRTDAPNSEAKRLEAMENHIQYTISNKHRFHVGGALRHEVGAKAVGSAMIIAAESAEEAHDFASQDPFDQAGVYKRTDIWHFNAGVGDWLPDNLKQF